MKYQNFKSDFVSVHKFYEQEDGAQVQKPVPDHVRLTFFTEERRGFIIVERNGAETDGCSVSDDGLTLSAYVPLSRKFLGMGELICEIAVINADADFPDSIRTVVTPVRMDVTLWPGETNDDSEVESDIVLGFITDTVKQAQTAAETAQGAAEAAQAAAEAAQSQAETFASDASDSASAAAQSLSSMQSTLNGAVATATSEADDAKTAARAAQLQAETFADAAETAAESAHSATDMVAEGIDNVEARLESLEKKFKELISGDLIVEKLTLRFLALYGKTSLIKVYDGTPDTAPDFVPQFAYNKATGDYYKATGSASVSNWAIL